VVHENRIQRLHCVFLALKTAVQSICKVMPFWSGSINLTDM